MSVTHTVSMVQDAFKTETHDVRADKVIAAIRNGRWKEYVEEIRREDDKELVSKFKTCLPGVLFSGKFSERKNDGLVQHSGLLCADLDNLNGELQNAREKLLGSPYLFAVFTSPSGGGLKAVFRVPADGPKHKGSFRAVEQHVRELTGIQIDESCKDPARLCFVSYDPAAYHNQDATELQPLPEPQRPARFSSNGAIDLSARQAVAVDLLGPIDWQNETEGFCTCPGKERHTKVNRAKDCNVYLDRSPSIDCVHNSCRGILEGVNYALRSRIGKIEFIPPIAIDSEKQAAELLPAPAPYVPPPLALLPAPMREYVQAAAEAINVDIGYILLPLLSALGNAIGNSRSVLLKPGFIQPPIIWTGIIGRSGQRKSPAIDAGCFAMMEHERELMRQNKAASDAYDEELANWESKLRKDRGIKPTQPGSLTCLMDDMTLEALADTMQTNPRGVLVKKDELSHWLSSFDQYHSGKGSDVSRWLSLHTGAFFGVDRRTDHRRYRILQPRVCITGGIQPAVLARVLTQDFFERGLPARFLFAAPPMRKDRWSENTIPDNLRTEVLEIFDRLWLLQPEYDDNDSQRPTLLKLEPDARGAFVAYYNECGASAVEGDEQTEAAWNKLSGYAARLALIGQLAADPNATTVTGEVMEAACELARWFGAEALRTYASMAETAEQRETRKLVEFIQSRGGEVTARDVYTHYWPLRNQKDKAGEALSALVTNGYGDWLEIRPGDGSKGGRPTRKFRVRQASASAKPPALRGETLGCADAEGVETVQNTVPAGPVEAVTEPPVTANSGDHEAPGDQLIEKAKHLFKTTPAA